MRAVVAADRRVEVVENHAAELCGDLRTDAARRERLIDDQQPPGLAHRLRDRRGVERRDGARVDQLDGDALTRERIADGERAMHHQRERDHGHVAAFTDDARFSKLDRAVALGHAAFHREHFAVFEEKHGIIAAQRGDEQSLRVGGRGRHDDAQAGEVREHRVVISRVMRRRRVPDADAAAQQHRHREPPAAHVLHLRDLVENFAETIEHEIREHEIHDGPRPRHRRAAREADKPALANRRVAQPLRPVEVVKPRGRVEIPAAFSDALAEHEDARIRRHLRCERLVRGLHESQLARGRGVGSQGTGVRKNRAARFR